MMKDKEKAWTSPTSEDDTSVIHSPTPPSYHQQMEASPYTIMSHAETLKKIVS